jgi:mRNA-degrading endonuclease RelE of RelBE toxin-antitoxin system
VSYEVRISRDAQRYIERLDPTTRRRILHRLDELAIAPMAKGSKAVVGRGGLRASRVGDERIIFAVDLEAAVINVRAVASQSAPLPCRDGSAGISRTVRGSGGLGGPG